MTDAEIAGFMNWRGPGAYTASQLARVRRIVEEVQRRETEACAKVADGFIGCDPIAEKIRARSKA